MKALPKDMKRAISLNISKEDTENLRAEKQILWFAGNSTASFRDVADRFEISISPLFNIIRRLSKFLSNMPEEIIT